MPGQARAALGQAAEIRGANGDTQSLDQRIDKALRLPERQAEHLTKHQADHYRKSRIKLRGATPSRLSRVPFIDHFFGKIDREIVAVP